MKKSHALGYFATEKDAEAFLNLLMEVLWEREAIRRRGMPHPTTLAPRVVPGYAIEIQATETQAQALDLAFDVWRASA